MAFLDMGLAGSVVVRVSRQGISVAIDGQPMRGYDSLAALAWGEPSAAGEPTPTWRLGEGHLTLLRTQVPWCDAARAGPALDDPREARAPQGRPAEGPACPPGRRPNS